MEINTETYKSIGGDMLTRHYLHMGDRNYVLDTRELWQLVLLGIVELGKCLKESRTTSGQD